MQGLRLPEHVYCPNTVLDPRSLTMKLSELYECISRRIQSASQVKNFCTPFHAYHLQFQCDDVLQLYQDFERLYAFFLDSGKYTDATLTNYLQYLSNALGYEEVHALFTTPEEYNALAARIKDVKKLHTSNANKHR
eukprot:jgi/Chrzof1/6322/Cz18g04070.t1